MHNSPEPNLPHRADYTRAIYETLLRIEGLLRDRARTHPPAAAAASAPDRAPKIFGKAALSMREAAEALGLGLSKLKELVYTKQIRSVRAGRRLLIPAASVESFLGEDP